MDIYLACLLNCNTMNWCPIEQCVYWISCVNSDPRYLQVFPLDVIAWSASESELDCIWWTYRVITSAVRSGYATSDCKQRTLLNPNTERLTLSDGDTLNWTTSSASPMVINFWTIPGNRWGSVNQKRKQHIAETIAQAHGINLLVKMSFRIKW